MIPGEFTHACPGTRAEKVAILRGKVQEKARMLVDSDDPEDTGRILYNLRFCPWRGERVERYTR